MQFDIVANDKATASMAKVEKSAENFGKKLSGSLTMAAAKAGLIIGAIQKIGQVIGDQVDITDQAARLGLDEQVFQRLKFASEQYGASIEDVGKGLVKVNNVLDEAATKGGPNAEVLRALGFAQDEITNRAIKAEEVYGRLAEAIKEAASEEEKFALASRVFGDRMAQTMVPILGDFATFNAMQGKVLTMTNENAKALDNFSERAALAAQDSKALFSNFVGAAIRKLGMGAPIAEAAPKADTEAARARGKAAREALLKAGAKETKPAGVEGLAVTSLQEIGGGIARGPSAMESYAARTAQATETIAANTAGAAAAPQTGSTDVTKPSIPGRVVGSVGDVLRQGMPKATPKAAPDPFTTSRRSGLTRTF